MTLLNAIGVLAVQVTIVAAVGLVGAALFRRDAANRHAVLFVSLIALFGCPMATVVFGHMGWSFLNLSTAALRANHAEEIVAERVRPPIDPTSPVPMPTPPAHDVRANLQSTPIESTNVEPIDLEPAGDIDCGSRTDFPPIDGTNVWAILARAMNYVPAIWIAGIVMLLARLMYGVYLARRVCRSAVQADSAQLAGISDRVESLLESSQPPRILISDSIGTAVAVGWIRPAIVLPRLYLNSLSNDELFDVLTHEAAHLVRRDGLIGVLQRLAEAAYWPHPLVHILNRRLSRAREEICDNYVLHQRDAGSYARLLLRLVELPQRPTVPTGMLALISARWKLDERVAGLVDSRRMKSIAAKKRVRLAAPVLFVAIGCILAGLRFAGAADNPVVAADEKLQSPPGSNPALLDDPLPAGAVLRLGDTRSRMRDQGMPQLVFLPDEKTLVSVSEGSSVNFWEVPSGRLLRHVDGLAGLKLPSTDFTRASIHDDKLSRDELWRIQEGGLVSPDGKRMALGWNVDTKNRDHLEIRDVKTGKRELTLRDPATQTLFVNRLEFTPDGNALVANNSAMVRDAAILVWDAHTGKLRHRFSVPGIYPRTFAISPDGRFVATANEVSLHVWDLATGEPVGTPIIGHNGYVSTVLFSPTSNRVITASDDFSCRIWDSVSGQEVAKLNHKNVIRAAAISPDGTLVATSSLDNTVGIWQVASGKRINSLQGHGERGGMRALEFSSDGTVLYSWGDDRKLRVWNLKSGKLLREFKLIRSGTDDSTSQAIDDKESWRWFSANRISATCFLSGGEKFVIVSLGGYWVFDTRTGAELTKKSTGTNIATIAPLHGRNQLVITGHEIVSPKPDDLGFYSSAHIGPAKVAVIDVDSGTTVWSKEMSGDSRPTSRSWGRPASVSYDDKLVAVTVREGSQALIRFLDARTGAEVKTIEGADPVNADVNGAFSPDGSRLAFSQQNATVLIWDLNRLGVAVRP